MEEVVRDRRGLLALGAAAVAAACASSRPADGEVGREEDVGPAEDLMREHGVLSRLLLVDEECARRIGDPGVDASAGTLLEALRGTSELAKRFVHDYHENLEEREVFPRLERAGREVALVGVLRAQHAAGRKATDRIRALVEKEFPREAKEREELAAQLAAFARMYRPHEAREDTVLFPAFHGMFDSRDWDRLGEMFEAREHEVLGRDGFERAVEQVAGFERALGIHDLAKFTATG
jgi:hemerythrin-like domain-containing protein